jgi:hypothetical protein
VVASIQGYPTTFPFTLLLDWNTASAEVVTVTQAATGTGPYTFANSVRGDDGTAAVSHGVGATVNHGVSARDFQKHPMVENILSYGGDPTGTNDSSTALTNMITALFNAGGGVGYCPPGNYKFTTGNVPFADSVHVFGDGYGATKFTYTGTGVNPHLFDADSSLTGPTGHIEDFQLHGITITSTGGDIFWGANVVRNKITGNCFLPQSNGFAVWNVQNGTGTHNTGYMAECEFNNKEQISGASRTIEAWHLDFSYTGSLAANDNWWHGGGSKIWGSNQGDVNMFWMKLIGASTGNTGSRKNRWSKIVFEYPQGGMLHLQNTTGAVIEDFTHEDLTGKAVGTNPMILLDGVAAGDGCNGCRIVDYARRGGPTNSIIDIQLNANCQQIEICSPSLYSGGQPLYIDCKSATGVALTGAWPTGFYTLLNAQNQVQPVNPLIDPAAAPSAATGQTAPLWAVTATGSALTSGTIYLVEINLLAGTPINNITFVTDSTVEAGGTHGWYVLCDSSRKVQAVSADQTGAAVWGSANSAVTLSVSGSNYTATYTGKYYVGVCIVATTMPTLSASPSMRTNIAGAIGGSICGTSNTAQTTPPALATVLNSISGLAGTHFYAYTS